MKKAKTKAKTTKKASKTTKMKKLSASKLKKLTGGGFRDRPDTPSGPDLREGGGPVGNPVFGPRGGYGLGSNRARAGRGQTK